MLQISCFILILLGDVLMIFTALRYSRLIRWILRETNKSEGLMRTMLICVRVLPFFFVAGYTAGVVYTLLNKVEPFFIMVSLVFFFGAIFVALVVHVQAENTSRLRKHSINIEGSNKDLKLEIDNSLAELLRQDSLMRMINNVATKLLAANARDFVDTMHASMELIGSAMNIERVYVWCNVLEKNRPAYRKMYGWEQQIDENHAFEIPSEKFLYAEGSAEWLEKYKRGESVRETIEHAAGSKKDLLERLKIKSIIMLPVFLHDELWGFVSFDACSVEREFSDAEEEILRSLSLLLVNAITHNSSELALAQRFRQQRETLRISQSFLSKEDMPRRINDSIQSIGGLLAASCVTLAIMGKGCNSQQTTYIWCENECFRPETEQWDFDALIHKSFPPTVPENAIAPVLSCNDIIAEPQFKDINHTDARAFIWTPIYLDGTLRGVLSVVDCISAREWSEGEKQLVSIVGSVISGAVTRDIYETARTAALEEAVRASKAKGDFLSNMSHEMRTPMNAIIGMTSIGRAAPDIDKKNYAFDKIENASAHMLGVVNDILDMSKIEANKMELVLTEFDFERMLRKVVNVINFRVEEKQQDFTVHIDRALPPSFVGDDQRLTQVLTNLLSNAVKFTPEHGRVHLEVQLVDKRPGFCSVRVSVSDSGIGISAEQQSKLFTSFNQAESSTSRKFGGTGLGLAITKRIIDLMEGKVWIESELGRGATFIFEIEMHTGASKNKTCLVPELNPAGLRVLLVEGSESTRRYFAEIADEIGIMCDFAADIPAAEALLSSGNGYCICFVNSRMLSDDASRLIARFGDRYSKSCKLVILSATDWSTIESEAIAGADAFLSKPLFTSTVIECINDVLAGTASPKEIEHTEESEDFSKHCILLAEDVELNREIVLALLEPTGLEIVCAENGIEALEIYAANPERYEMIFMDIQMPEMDGHEATQNIRRLPMTCAKWVPIVAMTANVFREDVENCIASGMDDHIGKPLDFDAVIGKLRKYLTHSSGNGIEKMSDFDRYSKGLEWLPEFETGNTEIDEQHKQIFRVMGDLLKASSWGEDAVQVGNMLEFLLEYSSKHFEDEEILQRKYNYYDYENHKKQHELFKEKVSDLYERFNNHEPSREIAETANSLVVRWLVHHIKQEDAKIARHIRNADDE